MKLFVGIDVSSKNLDVCFLDSEDTRLKETTYPNDIHGATQMKEAMLAYNGQFHYEKIMVGMESTSVYSFHPAHLLSKDKDLQRIGVEVVVQNPKAIHRFKGLFEEDKTDRIDAFRIADFLRFGRYHKTVMQEEKYVALQRLTRSRYQVVQQLTESKQHFLENLYYKCNTLTTDIDTSVFGSTMMELLTDSFSLDDIAAMDLEELALFLQKRGKGRFKDPDQLAKDIQKATRDSYRLGKVMEESVDMVLATYARLIQTLKKQVKELEKGIQALFEMIPEAQCLTSIPGISDVYAAGITAELAQIDRFDTEAQIAKYAGLYWKRKQSGDFESERTPRVRSGNPYLRYYLVEAANSVQRNEPVYRQFYLKKYKEVPKYKHKRALVMTARKLVRLVDVLLRNRQLYTPERSV
ncbi:IS110 family RNA-guided transposase [Gracilibacillus timonensis]|uniref:IS110 family transposase n=1 Tax=Gracilibacillus timonensis TaxID=1816696 RepID=UPI000825207C|nr:IS110 family transposase [Gracilibacillus timonensis]